MSALLKGTIVIFFVCMRRRSVPETFLGSASAFTSEAMFVVASLLTNPGAEILLIGGERRLLQGIIAADRNVQVVDEDDLEERIGAPLRAMSFEEVTRRPLLRFHEANLTADLKVSRTIAYDIQYVVLYCLQ